MCYYDNKKSTYDNENIINYEAVQQPLKRDEGAHENEWKRKNIRILRLYNITLVNKEIHDTKYAVLILNTII